MTKDFGSFTEENVQRCPFPLVATLHREAPIYLDPVTGIYVITRYDDIAEVNAQPGLFSNTTTITFGGGEAKPGYAEVQQLYDAHGWRRMHTLVTADPPVHTRYRSLVDKIFTPSFVKKLEPYVTDLCNSLIDAFIGQGTVDLQTEYCLKVPMFIIADQLGVPREDWEKFRHWSDSAISLINPALEKEEWIRLVKINIEMQQYLAMRQAQYQAEPADNLLSLIANAEIDGERLSTREFVSLGHQFLVAGNETTAGALAQAVAMLIREPAIMARLRTEREKIPAFVEESLRMHSPSPHVYRRVMADTEVGGVPLKEGQIVMVSYLSGNQDPEKYECPAQLDIDRKGIRNHLAFGRGVHHCIGNQLARAEIRIGLNCLFDRLATLAFDPALPEPRLAAVFHIHQLDSLHIAFTPAHEAALAPAEA